MSAPVGDRVLAVAAELGLRTRGRHDGWLLTARGGVTISIRRDPDQPWTLRLAAEFAGPVRQMLPEQAVTECAVTVPVDADVDTMVAAARTVLDGGDSTVGARALTRRAQTEAARRRQEQRQVSMRKRAQLTAEHARERLGGAAVLLGSMLVRHRSRSHRLFVDTALLNDPRWGEPLRVRLTLDADPDVVAAVLDAIAPLLPAGLGDEEFE